MNEVIESLKHAFLLAKQQGIILNSVDFESYLELSSTRDKFYVRCADLRIKSTTMRGDQE